MGFLSRNGLFNSAAVVIPVMLPWMLRNRWMLFGLLTCGILIAGLLAESFVSTHYAAPITCLIFVFVLQAMRLWRWRDRVTGRFLVCLITFFCLYSLVHSVYAEIKNGRSHDWRQDRARIIQRLEQQEGKHLVIVRYGPEHRVAHEYVYNEADVDNAKVVWAHDMGRGQNRELVKYFDDRQLWLLEPDRDFIPRLKPYSVN